MVVLLKYFLYFISSIAVLTAMVVVYLVWFQSPFYFPKPTGQYSVGTTTYHWIDTTRQESLSNDSAHSKRELMVQIWYPTSLKLRRTSPAKGTLPGTPYAPYHIIYFLRNNPSIAQMLSNLSCPIYSYAEPKAALANDEPHYPVIIFSHGNGGIRNLNTAQFEELASQGYIVVGISHTYYSSLVKFPDGRSINVCGFAERKEEERKKGFFNFVDKEIEIWVADVQFVLDQLEQLSSDQTSPFYQRMDKENIGMFGHSFGGATAIQICRREPRVKAGVCLDGALLGTNATQAFNKPFIFMLGEYGIKDLQRPWTKEELKKYDLSTKEEEAALKSTLSLQNFEEFAQTIGKDAYTIVIKKAGHMSFCDIILLQYALPFFRLFKNLRTGSIDGFRTTEIVNAYLVNFFNKYLKGKPSELLDDKT